MASRRWRRRTRLVAHADRSGWPVVHVQHEAPADSPLFAQGSRLADIHADIQPGAAHLRVRKRMVSVFAASDLGADLKARGITHLVISRQMTHACVAGAGIAAFTHLTVAAICCADS